MRRLTSLDVQFLAAEDGRTHGHLSALSILDPWPLLTAHQQQALD
jgi:diacylglycerol O-acyltransferase